MDVPREAYVRFKRLPSCKFKGAAHGEAIAGGVAEGVAEGVIELSAVTSGEALGP